MAMLTTEQAELLKWIVDSGSGEVLLVTFGNSPDGVAIIPDGPRQKVSPSDFRELVSQGLVRHVKKDLHEVTNNGKLVYQELTQPPAPEPPPVGFQPPK